MFVCIFLCMYVCIAIRVLDLWQLEFSTHLMKCRTSTHIFRRLEKSQSVKNCAGNLSDSCSLAVKLSRRHHHHSHVSVASRRGRRYCALLSVLMNRQARTASPAGLTCPSGRLCICREVAKGKVDGRTWVGLG